MDDLLLNFNPAVWPSLDDEPETLFIHPPPGAAISVPSSERVSTFSAATSQSLSTALPPLGDHMLEAAVASPPPLSVGQAGATQNKTSVQERAATAREKNRLAQRRFREKERQRLAEAEAKAHGLEAQVSMLRAENAELARWQQLMEKTLAVRNAMLSLTGRLQEPPDWAKTPSTQPEYSQELPPGSNPAAVAAVRAVGGCMTAAAAATVARELPSAEQVQALLHQLPSLNAGGASMPPFLGGAASGAAGRQGGGYVSLAMPEEESGGLLSATPCMADVMAAAAATSISGSGGGSSCRVVEELQGVGAPSPDNPRLRQHVQELECVDQLVAQWRQCKARLVSKYNAAAAGGFKAGAAMEALDAEVKGLAELFWYAAQLKPGLFKTFVVKCLPPRGAGGSANGGAGTPAAVGATEAVSGAGYSPATSATGASAALVSVAKQSLEMLSEEEIAILRQAWQRYMRRAAVAAVAARPWVQRLRQLLQGAGSEAMADAAHQHLKVGEVCARLSRCCHEQYTAILAFLREIGTQVNSPVRCYWHLSAGNHLPDHPAIISEILRLHRQHCHLQQQQAAQQQAQPPTQATEAGRLGVARPLSLPPPWAIGMPTM